MGNTLRIYSTFAVLKYIIELMKILEFQKKSPQEENRTGQTTLRKFVVI